MNSINRFVPKLSNLGKIQYCRTLATTTISPASNKSVEVSTPAEKRKKNKESWRSYLAGVFGGYYDPADPNSPPIPSSKVNFPDVTDHATGEEKLFLLAFENGILDPYCNLPVESNGRGSKDNPIHIASFGPERMIACSCEPSQTFKKFTIVHKGEPKRCHCGHWIELVDAPRFWEKIPKEDLIEIPFFRDLEEEGKLDKFLTTGELEDDEHKQLH